MRFIRITLYLVLILLAITFAALNASSVEVNLYVTNMTLPLSVLIVIMIAIGVLIGVLISLPKFWKCKLDSMKTKNQLKMTEKEIKKLRN